MANLNVKAAWSFILAWVFLMLFLALFIQSRDYYGNNPILRRRLGVVEPFQSKDTEGNGEVSALSPGDPDLNSPRTPYNLLNGWLPPADKQLRPTSEQCYGVDFQKRLEPTGNYRQMTNNYKRGDPDSCSGLNHDLVLGFYKVDPLA
jgi:hypothetical protein